MTKIQIIETVVVVLIYIIHGILVNRSVDKIVVNNISLKTRGKIIKKVINLIAFLILTIVIFSIYGVDQSELLVFIGSVLTVLGIALFAQWSILSNITSGVIIFFNHSAKLDDTITIMDKDYEVEGRISDIGLFFVIIKTKEDVKITIPNSVFINKMIKSKINS
jgi:small-conductance mechanosensitive channel